VTVTSDLFAYGDNLSKGEGIYDSFGQTIETRKFEAGGYVSSRAEYNLFGRVVKASNPFRPYLNETPVWTTSEYDTLGRTVRTQAADDSEATTVYEGNVTTVTDQAGKQRRSIVNAIGQLVRVDEPNSQNDLGPINNPAQAISYAYNTNGDMVKVTQGQQSRYFLFDSVGRLLRVRQPEQDTNPSLDLSDPVTGNTHWSAASTYDGNGNTLTNTDAKSTVVTNTYDAQNRPLTRTYSDTTPPVTYTYDDPNIAFSKGQLTKVSSSVSTTEYTSFDAAGKVLTHRQTTGGQVYTTSYAYNLSGDLTEETYPSGRVVRNTYNNDDRLSAVSSKSASQSAFQVYADSFAYTAWGAISNVRLGNGRWESRQFNSRLQVTRISLGNSQNAGDLLSVNYDYGEFDAGGNLQADKNSGNIARQTINFTGLAQPFVQTYKYDSLNRLSEATEMSADPQTFNRYAYVTNNPLTATDPTGMFSDRDWYTVDPEVMFQSYDDGFNVSRPLRDTYVIRRTTITTTTVHAQDVAGRQVVMEATVTITETAVDYIDEHGTLMRSDPVKTTAVARDVNDRPKQFSELQIRTMENVAIAIVEVSREKNFDPTWALAIAAYETHLGTNPSKEKASWKRSEINPMQLSGGKARPSKDMSDADALRFNIRGAIDLFNSNPGSLNEKLRAYGDPSNKSYDTDVVARINSIRTSQRSYTKEELIISLPQMYEPGRPRP
jgi:YD repeat-containing protein